MIETSVRNEKNKKGTKDVQQKVQKLINPIEVALCVVSKDTKHISAIIKKTKSMRNKSPTNPNLNPT